MATVLAPATAAELLGAAERRLRAADVDTARLDAEVLLASTLAADRAALYTRLAEPVPAPAAARFAALLDRRCRREPIAHLTGMREFWSLPFAVSPAVLIPRPETELLVEIVCRLARGAISSSPHPVPLPAGEGTSASSALHAGFPLPQGEGQGEGIRHPAFDSRLPSPVSMVPSPVSICDIGTGSGCIAVALARELPDAYITATDVSADALALAAENSEAHGVARRITLMHSDVFDALPREADFDLIVSNPPYLAPGDAVSPELVFEPALALGAGSDGLAVIRRLIAGAPARLRPGGWLVMELGRDQEHAVRALATAAGLEPVAVASDLAGIPRALVGRRALRVG